MAGAQRRPLERRVQAWADTGHDLREIAARFRRSPEFIDRVLTMARIDRAPAVDGDRGQRPLERRILRWRERGASFDDIAARFNRSPAFVERVVGFTKLRQGDTTK